MLCLSQKLFPNSNIYFLPWLVRQYRYRHEGNCSSQDFGLTYATLPTTYCTPQKLLLHKDADDDDVERKLTKNWEEGRIQMYNIQVSDLIVGVKPSVGKWNLVLASFWHFGLEKLWGSERATEYNNHNNRIYTLYERKEGKEGGRIVKEIITSDTQLNKKKTSNQPHAQTFKVCKIRQK